MHTATTTQFNQTTLEELQDLIKINIDSTRGFREAADEVEHPQLSRWLKANADQRETFARELQSHVSMSDEQARDTGSMRGSFHRWWMNLRSMLSGDQAETVLSEAIRGEEAIKNAYESAIKQTTGNPINDVLHKQYAEIVSSYKRIVSLRDAKSD